LSEEPESVVGAIPVSTQLRAGTELLTIFLTQKRMILAYQGKRGLGSLPAMAMVGRWGGGFEDAVKAPAESKTKKIIGRRPGELSPKQLLTAGKHNFDIAYSDIVRVEVDLVANTVGIMLLTKDEKFQFLTTRSFDYVSGVLGESLGDKVEIVRRP